MPILKVFIHDPLYKWALTPLGAQQRQKDFLMGGDDSSPGEGTGGPQPAPVGMAPSAVGSTDTTIANADAERALLRLKQKLAGLEGGEPLVHLTLCARCLLHERRQHGMVSLIDWMQQHDMEVYSLALCLLALQPHASLLQCCCAGQGESRGVKGQVQQLLQDAQSADKLCKMYVGWSAWL